MQIRTLISSSTAAILTGVLLSGQAYGWGHTGHLMISQLAIQTLPAEVPAFLRSSAAVRQISELGAEPDVRKSEGDAGTPNASVFDFEHGSAHFIDLDDSGNVFGISTLPLSSLLAPGQGRRDYDTALRAAGTNEYNVGYSPFEITDGWQQIRKDFAYFRAYTAAIANPATAPADKVVFQGQLALRQQLLIRDIGYWSHFVADASQPMHVTLHFNGWGSFPNPNGYTKSPIHAPFEGSFVKKFISINEALPLVGPYNPCNCAGIEGRVRSYLAATLATVDTTYKLEKAANNAYATDDPDEHKFIVSRLAAGAAELRDEIVDAWRSSATTVVGFPLIKVSDIESGAIVLTPDKIASD